MGCCTSAPAEEKMNNAIKVASASEMERPTDFSDNKQQNNGKSVSFKNENGKNQNQNKNKNKDTPTPPEKEEEPSQSYTPVDLDNSENDERNRRMLEKELKIQQKQSEIQIKTKKLEDLKNKAFEDQVKQQQSQGFAGLYQVFTKYAPNKKMDIDGLTEALKVFGMMIDVDKNLQKFVYSKFDLDEAGSFDYDDFSAEMSALIGTKTEEALLIMFQIFDIDQDGYLQIDDMARILLAQNQIAVITTGSQQETTVKYTKHQCIKQARKMVSEHDSHEFNDSKISFDEFSAMMMKRDANDMMIDHMIAPSMSVISIDKKQTSTFQPGQSTLIIPSPSTPDSPNTSY